MVLPGEHVAPGIVPWPNVPGIHVFGYGSAVTRLSTSGSGSFFDGDVSIAGFRGSISGVAIKGDPPIVLVRTPAADDGEFTLTDVVVDASIALTGFKTLELDGVVEEGSSTFSCQNCRDVTVARSALGFMIFGRGDGGIVNLDVIASTHSESTLRLVWLRLTPNLTTSSSNPISTRSPARSSSAT